LTILEIKDVRMPIYETFNYQVEEGAVKEVTAAIENEAAHEAHGQSAAVRLRGGLLTAPRRRARGVHRLRPGSDEHLADCLARRTHDLSGGGVRWIERFEHELGERDVKGGAKCRQRVQEMDLDAAVHDPQRDEDVL
jgi:hypothetical protein